MSVAAVSRASRAWLIVAAVVAVLAIAGWFAYRSEAVALALMDRSVVANFTGDALNDLPDGLHVMVCGAGGPLQDINRSGSCVAIQAGPHLYVVDAGTNGARNLGRFGVGVGRVEGVFITHAHSDHIDGLGELGVLRWANGNRAAPLPVHGPPVVEDVVAGFNRAYAPDVRYRVAHHGEAVVPASGAGLSAVSFPLPADGELATLIETAEGVRVSAFRVAHPPVDEAVGYRFDYGGRAVVVSGDTAKSANLIQHAQGVDLLLHEALASRMTDRIAFAAESVDGHGAAKIMRDVPSYHSTPVEAAEAAAEAQVGHLVLYHIIPPLPLAMMERVFMAGVSEAYRGPVTLGTDGTMVSLPRVSG